MTPREEKHDVTCHDSSPNTMGRPKFKRQMGQNKKRQGGGKIGRAVKRKTKLRQDQARTKRRKRRGPDLSGYSLGGAETHCS